MKIATLISSAALALVAVTGVASAQSTVPGSDFYRDARADARANSVITGTRANAVQQRTGTQSFGYPAPSVNGMGAEIVGRATVPGSDYYTESRADARANSVINGTRANDVITR